MATSKLLVMFDFAKTIIDDNVETSIRKLLPGGKVPQDIKDQYKEHDSWTRYIADILSCLHHIGVQKSEMLESVREVPFTPGMLELLKYQEEMPSIDAIIVSDSNSLFIGHILEGAGLHGAYKEIFSNPAEFDASGRVLMKHHHQHECKRCPENLCKGTVLREYLLKSKADGLPYDRVAVVGDGFNDFCPCLDLRQNDMIFPRKGYRLMKLIEQCSKDEPDGSAASGLNGLKATVIPWDTAHEIQQYLQRIVDSQKVDTS